MKTRIGGYVDLTVSIRREGDQWSALCHELGTAACGDTFEEAHQAIEELLVLDLNSMEELGMRKAFFKKHGIVFHRVRPTRHPRPKTMSLRRNEFVTSILQPVPELV